MEAVAIKPRGKESLYINRAAGFHFQNENSLRPDKRFGTISDIISSLTVTAPAWCVCVWAVAVTVSTHAVPRVTGGADCSIQLHLEHLGPALHGTGRSQLPGALWLLSSLFLPQFLSSSHQHFFLSHCLIFYSTGHFTTQCPHIHIHTKRPNLNLQFIILVPINTLYLWQCPVAQAITIQHDWL